MWRSSHALSFSWLCPNVIGKSLLISNNSLSSSLPIMENSGTTLHSLLNWGKGKGGNLEKPDWVDWFPLESNALCYWWKRNKKILRVRWERKMRVFGLRENFRSVERGDGSLERESCICVFFSFIYLFFTLHELYLKCTWWDRFFSSVALFWAECSFSILWGISAETKISLWITFCLSDSCFPEYITVSGLGHEAALLSVTYTSVHRIQSKVISSKLFILLQIKMQRNAR